MKNTFLLVVFVSSMVLGQSLKEKPSKPKFEFGISFESSLLLSTEKTKLIYPEDSYETFENTTSDFYPLNVYLSGFVFINKSMGIEFKPGWFLGGDRFTGYELGLYLKKYFCKNKLFGKAGINFHKNSASAHINFSSTDKGVFLLGAAVGYKPFRNIALTVSYHHVLSNYWNYHEIPEGDFLSNNVYLNQIIKFGLEFNL